MVSGTALEIEVNDAAHVNGEAATWETGANVVTATVTNGANVKTYTVTVTKGE